MAMRCGDVRLKCRYDMPTSWVQVVLVLKSDVRFKCGELRVTDVTTMHNREIERQLRRALPGSPDYVPNKVIIMGWCDGTACLPMVHARQSWVDDQLFGGAFMDINFQR